MSDANDTPSKTQVKKEMDALHDLGLRLTHFSSDTLLKAGLPENIVAAAADYQKIRSNSALKRQAQYIGRLMREAGADEIQQISDYLALIDGENTAHNAKMQRLEQWRTRLMADDNALTDYLNTHPDVEAGALRTLIRNARKEAAAGKPPKAYRALFQILKNAVEAES